MNNYLKEAIKIEVYKILKNKVNLIYILMILGLAGASLVGIKLFEKVNDSNAGYVYLIFYLQTLSTTIFPIMLLLFSTIVLSSEITQGTIRNVLAAGCSKTQFLFSKIVASLIFQSLLMLVAVITAILISYFFFGLENISEDGVIIMSKGTFWAYFFFAYFLLSIGLFAASSFGILIAALTRNSINAILISIGIFLLLEVIKTKLHIAGFVFSTYLEWPLTIVSEFTEGFYSSWMPRIFSFLAVSFSWIVLSLFLSFKIIKNRDFK